ncbi:DUF1015 family protein [Streptomyces sp. TRM 70361]|uniref:DUF1015 family protein n=1 Tax=Streptomyces sp. TRM 70361 TaxID=3116553 RepID=UPI002E7AAF17|nr:DUF1015 family protein [Streptomyces sp. TRM 70361]MEE1943023.1 DUF1015 family protein [Streptomyces sp. TRM 70361]
MDVNILQGERGTPGRENQHKFPERRAAPLLHPFSARVAGMRSGIPADFFVLEQWAGRQVIQRGLVGALDLRALGSGAVRRHEAVEEDRVERVRQRMCATEGCDEPVLLLARAWAGAGPGPDPVCGAAVGVTPRTGGGEQRLFRAGAVPRVDGPLLVADGHHRLEAALRLQREHSGRSGPWDRLPALVVDAARHPPALTAINRVIPGIGVRQAVRAVAGLARVVRCDASARPEPREPLLCGSGEVWRITGFDPDVVRGALSGSPRAWARLDTALADRVVIPAIRSAGGARAEEVRCVHRPPQPQARGGVGIVLAPPTTARIWWHASAGVPMPRKTSSFGPKPVPGQITYPYAVP